MRTDISGRNDAWLFDERLDRKYQIDNSYYAHDQFDRGHLTRREDMEWGTDPKDAVNKANGTCTWTNCTPQHAAFNEGKDPSVLLWAQLEHYILEESAKAGHFKAQVITGPIFGSADPEYRDIAYPLEFWKIVAAVATKNGKDQLFATGYILGQKATIAKFGLEEALEVPFGEFGTYQRPISLIENLTGLRFTYGNNKPLSDVDPLAKPSWRPKVRRKADGTQEAFAVPEDDALQSFDDIVLL
jgi:endonuclease G